VSSGGREASPAVPRHFAAVAASLTPVNGGEPPAREASLSVVAGDDARSDGGGAEAGRGARGSRARGRAGTEDDGGAHAITRPRDCASPRGDESEIPWKGVTMLRSLMLRYGYLAALILAAGAGKKWL